ncbi:MAG TPA: HEAT repeat domain-containing protein [bacterium]|nr:HEAT repeat domain-containing protein [bacterium]HPN46110.1 HEAT repeat domain-containing protein [bacterium]
MNRTRFYLFFILLLLANMAAAKQVGKYEGEPQSLARLWQWAEQQNQGEREYWIGYSITQSSPHNVIIGCYSNGFSIPTLAAILNQQDLGTAGSDTNDGMVEKEMAFLFLIADKSNTKHREQQLHISHFDAQVDLQGKPLTWLGHFDQQESFTWLIQAWHNNNTRIPKKHILVAAAQHRVDGAVPFLSAIPFSKEDIELQKEAVFWLGQIPDAAVIPVLEKALFEHLVNEIQKAAVFALSEVDDDGAVDILIKAAKKHSNDEIRKESIFWLGQMAGERAAKSLNDLVYSEPELELKKQAVFALSEMDDDFGLTSLIQIATNHPSLEVRKSAIFWLGESDDARALDAIVGIIKDN